MILRAPATITEENSDKWHWVNSFPGYSLGLGRLLWSWLGEGFARNVIMWPIFWRPAQKMLGVFSHMFLY